MKITKIEKKKRLYLLELNETERLYITEDTIVRFMLTKGMTVSEQELNDIRQFAQFSYGKNLALYFISFKQRTEKEVRDYLYKHEIEASIIPQVLDNLKADLWINDKQFVISTVEQNLSSGDKGAFVIKQKLMQKGISSATIDGVLADYDFTEVAERVAQKLLRKYDGKLAFKALKDRLNQSLTNKGFSYSEAKLAIDSLDLEKNEATEEELIYQELDKQYRKYSRKYEGYDLRQRLTQALARKGYDFDSIRSALRDYL
ncbi:recombination regulator RecX [Streptococcus hyovaginalis]|uniref:recombination regulator RecX n=1 Tax=Streptococcus hyovaginalis TaxID=149015 RepID=UPI002A83CF75|nr:recombination regulator RecX [Streptococcus hyovaginalis]MDY4511006.1 recombination regulator RecX [Streptococcus hyovaginalis]